MIIGLMAVFISVIGLFIYNSLIGKKNEVKNAMGGLDAHLKQRYDLIPNLISSVKTYMTHEASLLEKIVELRNKAVAGNLSLPEKQDLNSEISKRLSQLVVSVEQYPDLKSSANFQHLQHTLYDVEQNIAASRRFYNAAITDYNNAIEMFPSNIIAKFMGLALQEVFSIPELEKAVPNVEGLFNSKAS